MSRVEVFMSTQQIQRGRIVVKTQREKWLEIQKLLDEKFGIKHIKTISQLTDYCKTALKASNYDMLRPLIYEGSPLLSIRFTCGGTILHIACGLLNIKHKILYNLLRVGANINAQKANGFTPLHIALIKEISQFRELEQNSGTYFRTTKFLIKKGANLDIRNQYNNSPVDRAVRSGCLEAIKVFSLDDCSYEPSNEYLIKCLLKKNYYTLTPQRSVMLLKLSIINSEFESLQYIWNETKQNFTIKKNRRKTYESIGNMAMRFAVIKGERKYIQFFVREGFKPQIYTASKGQFSIYLRLQFWSAEYVKCLLDCGLSVDFSLNDEIPHAVTLLNLAISKHSIEIVKLLLEKGANVNACSYGESPLIWASKASIPQRRIVELLLDYGAEIEAKCLKNCTALSYACKIGRFDIVKILLNRGAKLERINITTLHYAVLGMHPHIVKMILEQGLSLNYSCDVSGYGTPLKLAVSKYYSYPNGYLNVLNTLLAHVAKMIATNKYLSKENRDVLKDEHIKEIYEKYAEELTKMKERNISPELNFSFLDILTKDIDYLGSFLKQDDLTLMLNEGKYQEEFANFSNDLKSRIKEAILRRSLVELGSDFLLRYTKKKIPFEILLIIFKNLTIKDLTNLSFLCKQ